MRRSPSPRRGGAASSTAFQISPQLAAVSASSGSASSASAFARGSPRMRASDQLPPASGTRPILEKAWMNLAERAASTMSQAKAMFAPGTGGNAVHRADHRLLDARGSAAASGCRSVSSVAPRSGAPPPLRGSRSPRSCPAEKPRPAPVSRIVRTAVVAGGALETGAQREVHLLVERIELVRPIERQGEHPGLKRDQNGVGLRHQFLPPALMTGARRKKLLHKPTGQSIIKPTNAGETDGDALRPPSRPAGQGSWRCSGDADSGRLSRRFRAESSMARPRARTG